MRDTYTSENHRDFNARYAHTYGWLIQGQRRSLVFMEDGDEERFLFTAGTLQTYTAYIDGGAVFEFIPVKMGWFNSKDGEIVFLERHPARQWKRGICADNTWAYKYTPYGVTAERISYQLLASIFTTPIEVNKDFVVAKVEAKLPVALSQHFAIADGDIYFFKTPIGSMKNNIITLSNTTVKQELSDCIRRMGLPWSIAND